MDEVKVWATTAGWFAAVVRIGSGTATYEMWTCEVGPYRSSEEAYEACIQRWRGATR